MGQISKFEMSLKALIEGVVSGAGFDVEGCVKEWIGKRMHWTKLGGVDVRAAEFIDVMGRGKEVKAWERVRYLKVAQGTLLFDCCA